MAIITPPPKPSYDFALIASLRQESEGWSKGAVNAKANGNHLEALTCNQTANLCDRSISALETLIKYTGELEKVIEQQNEQSDLVRKRLIEYLKEKVWERDGLNGSDSGSDYSEQILGIEMAIDAIEGDLHLKKD